MTTENGCENCKTGHAGGDLHNHNLPANTFTIRHTRQVDAILTSIRDKNTPRDRFVFHSERLMRLIIEEGLSSLPFREVERESPCGKFRGYENIQKICGISILRAGEAFEGPFRQVCQGVRLGKILIQRGEDKLPKFYYENIPQDISQRVVFVLEPMIATGGTLLFTLERLVKVHNCKPDQIVILSLFASQDGLNSLAQEFPEVKVYTAAVDRVMNEKKYIVPGCGDFGDRFFGTA